MFGITDDSSDNDNSGDSNHEVKSRAYNDLFANFDYDSNLMILNMDNTFFLILIFPLHFLIVSLLNLSKNEKLTWIKGKIVKNF